MAKAASKPAPAKTGGTNKYIKYKTAPGISRYSKLHKAYSFDQATNRSVPDPEGNYSTELVFPTKSKEAQGLIALVKQAIADSGMKPANIPYYDIVGDDDEKTGDTAFKFKAYGMKKDGEVNRIKFYDADGVAIKGTVNVTGGSTLRLQGWISVAKMGARLNIRECQIIELAELQGEGFEAVAGGSFKASDIDGTQDDEEVTTENEAEETPGEEDEEF